MNSGKVLSVTAAATLVAAAILALVVSPSFGQSTGISFGKSLLQNTPHYLTVTPRMMHAFDALCIPQIANCPEQFVPAALKRSLFSRSDRSLTGLTSQTRRARGPEERPPLLTKYAGAFCSGGERYDRGED